MVMNLGKALMYPWGFMTKAVWMPRKDLGTQKMTVTSSDWTGEYTQSGD